MGNCDRAVHRTIVAVDVEGFADRERTNRHQVVVRDGLYQAMRDAFRRARIPWQDGDHEDRGDGMFILVGPEVPKSLFVESLPCALASALRAHNSARTYPERIRLRLALHAGEVNYDDHGATSAAINLTFRLLEAGPVKEALAASSGVLAVITSSWFFEEVVRHSAADVAMYHPVQVAVKETVAAGWICLPDRAEVGGGLTAAPATDAGRPSLGPSAGYDRGSQADFLARYRRHVVQYHGMLEPPDFEYRRRISVDGLYVPPAIVQLIRGSPQTSPREITLEQFSEEIGRTVLIGDPGGGKTTAAHVLMHSHAARPGSPVPFMVTLREFAADKVRQSVSGYLQGRLESFYQCPAPPRVVEHLLASEAALVIFDGLDELTDAALRADVTAVIERFCAEYPLACVLVTSRLAGYDQARPDDRIFTRYRLGGFDDQQVGDYVRKWFAHEEDLRPEEAVRRAAAFLAESESVPDLRANPLLLSLMCVLYRGEGSIPHSRPDIYAQCTSLLFRQWDARRHIDVESRARSRAELAIQHLGYWLLTRGQEQPIVTERELLRETSAFLQAHGPADSDNAEDAAQEFIAFWRNRAWMFSDAGTTADGQRLYAFTHPTFLEYFAAAHLAALHDNPEALALALAPRIARRQWEVVAELAVHIKSNSSERSAQRVYTALLSYEGCSLEERSNILQFLARCVRFTELPPRTIRDLTSAALDHLFEGDIGDEIRYLPLSWLLASCVTSCETVRDALATRIADMVHSGDPANHLNGLRLAIWVSRGAVFFRSGQPVVPAKAPERLADFWDDFAYQNAKSHAAGIAAAASNDEGMLYASLRHRFLTAKDVLATTDQGLTGLFTAHNAVIFGILWIPYLEYLAGAAARAWSRAIHSGLPKASGETMLEDFTAVGQYLIDHAGPPWLSASLSCRYEPLSLLGDAFTGAPSSRREPVSVPSEAFTGTPVAFKAMNPTTYLGIAAAILITAELTITRTLPADTCQPLGAFSDLYPYILRRWDCPLPSPLPDLPVPQQFQQLFRSWANQKTNFVEYTADAPLRSLSSGSSRAVV